MLSESLSWASAGVRLRGHTFYRDRAQFITTEGAFSSWVLIMPENGAFDYTVEDETGEVQFGEFVVAPPEGAFWRHVKSAVLTYHVLQWSFGDTANFPVGKSRVEDSARLLSNMALLRPLLGQRDPFSWRRIESVLEDLLFLAWETRQSRPPTQDITMREAARLLREKAGKSFSMSEVSAQLGLGPVQLTRRFRASYGQTPIEFLTELRLSNAQKMLIETDWTLEKIARECGWASGFYLSKVFAQKFGTSPGHFRKLHQV